MLPHMIPKLKILKVLKLRGFDPHNKFCKTETCLTVEWGIPKVQTFFPGGHLTA